MGSRSGLSAGWPECCRTALGKLLLYVCMQGGDHNQASKRCYLSHSHTMHTIPFPVKLNETTERRFVTVCSSRLVLIHLRADCNVMWKMRASPSLSVVYASPRTLCLSCLMLLRETQIGFRVTVQRMWLYARTPGAALSAPLTERHQVTPVMRWSPRTT